MPKPLKVNKQEFDNALRKLVNTAPVKKSDVKIEQKKPGKIISPQK